MLVKIDSIVIDAGTQARLCIDQETVEDYADCMTEGDRFPPVVLFHDGNDYYLGDGFHRVLAAEKLTCEKIDAEVRKGTKKDALWYALGANRTNGRRMTRGDLKHAVEIALQSWPERSQREISDQVGCTQQYVGKVQNELTTSCKLELPATRTGKDGKVRPTTYSKKAQTESKKTSETVTPIITKKELAALPPCMGMQFARLAIMRLEEIPKNDKEREQAFDRVVEWIKEQREA